MAWANDKHSEWTMERVCGLLGLEVKFRSQAYRNLSLAIIRSQQLNVMPYTMDYSLASDSDSNANASLSNENGHEGYAILESLIARLRSSKRQQKRNRSQNIIGHAYNAAILCEPKGKRALKGWERVLLQHYMETSSRWDEIEPPALIQLWKACKLNTVDHRRESEIKSLYNNGCQRYKLYSIREDTPKQHTLAGPDFLWSSRNLLSLCSRTRCNCQAIHREG